MTRRTTIATTYGTEIARLAERIDATPDLCVAIVESDPPSTLPPVTLATRPIVIGHSRDCDLPLDDPRVSDRHAEVIRDGGAIRVRDLGSTNGILIHGALVREAILGVGQVFVVGKTALRVQPKRRPAEVPPSQSTRFGELVGKSLPMRELFAVLELAAMSDATLLVTGETGTGKELVARAVHDQSPRRRHPFIAIDCGALPEQLIESALFGHVRGAFTGAHDARAGALSSADGGTLFLDEIGNLPLSAQARLLRALETRQVQPVGADQHKKVDVRLIAAAPTDLEKLVREGRFRADLYYRIAVVEVRLPTLRERIEDLPMLVTEILRRRGFPLTPSDPATTPDPTATIDPAALATLRSHSWPGNVRELRNVLERALALSPNAQSISDLRLRLPTDVSEIEGFDIAFDAPWPTTRDRLVGLAERRYFAELVRRHPDNVSAQARAAGIDRKTLRLILERHGLGGAD